MLGLSLRPWALAGPQSYSHFVEPLKGRTRGDGGPVMTVQPFSLQNTIRGQFFRTTLPAKPVFPDHISFQVIFVGPLPAKIVFPDYSATSLLVYPDTKLVFPVFFCCRPEFPDSPPSKRPSLELYDWGPARAQGLRGASAHKTQIAHYRHGVVCLGPGQGPGTYEGSSAQDAGR